MGVVHALAVDFDDAGGNGYLWGRTALGFLRTEHSRTTALILLTCQSRDELLAAYPDAEGTFDVVISENGALVHGFGLTRRLAPLLDPDLGPRLSAAGVTVREGECTLSCPSSQILVLRRAMAEADPSLQIRHVGDRLVVTPHGISKSGGLSAALHLLGLTQYNLVLVPNTAPAAGPIPTTPTFPAYPGPVTDWREPVEATPSNPVASSRTVFGVPPERLSVPFVAMEMVR